MKTKVIKEFKFDRAQYIVGDGSGGRVRLLVNYKKNTFKIIKNGNRVDSGLDDELVGIARDLLKRKHGINFAESKK